LALGVDQAECFKRADLCWDIINYDWGKNGGKEVRNDPDGNPQTNTITNVLFMLLGIHRYQVQGDTKALDTAKAVFEWFYNAKPPEPGKNQAWTGDQGWFWRTCLELRLLDPSRQVKITGVLGVLAPAVFRYVFQNKVVVELNYGGNFDIDFATGKGVFMPQFAIINMISDPKKPNQWPDWIRPSTQGAWDNSGWNIAPKTYANLPSNCWQSNATSYFSEETSVFVLWELTTRTAAQDAFNAYLTVGPE
jgi:hypothetical protein